MPGEGGKVSTSVKIESWQQEWLQDHNHLNASELYRRFLDELASGGHGTPDGLEFRESMLENEIAEIEETLEKKREQLADVREKIEERENVTDAELKKSLEVVADLPNPDPTNPAVKTQAGKHGYSPEEMVSMAEENFPEKFSEDGSAPLRSAP